MMATNDNTGATKVSGRDASTSNHAPLPETAFKDVAPTTSSGPDEHRQRFAPPPASGHRTRTTASAASVGAARDDARAGRAPDSPRPQTSKSWSKGVRSMPQPSYPFARTPRARATCAIERATELRPASQPARRWLASSPNVGSSSVPVHEESTCDPFLQAIGFPPCASSR